MARRRPRKTPNPTLAEAYDFCRADFRMSKESKFHSKLTGVASGYGSGADYHYRNEWDFLRMIERARHYQRNDPIVGQGVRRLTANVVQDGFRVDPQTGDDDLNDELKLRWDEWAESPELCHSEHEFSFAKLETLVFESTIVDGDIFVLPRRNGTIQLVESHRCRTPRNTKRNVVHGVHLSGQDAVRTEYWFTRQELDPLRALAKVSDVQRVPARDPDGNRQVWHVYDPRRSSQRRGVSGFAPISDTVGMFDDMQFATLVKMQVASMVTMIHEYESTFAGKGMGQQKGDQENVTTTEGTKLLEQIGPSMEVHASPGESITGFAPNIPGGEYVPYSTMLLTILAANIDIPVVVLLLDPSATNFSGWRGAMDQARLRFKQLHRWLIGVFHKPVYEWKVRSWMVEDPTLAQFLGRDGIKPLKARWHPPNFPYIEPLKDASADLMQQRNVLNSPRRIQAARGRDIQDIQDETIADNRRLIELAHEAIEKIRKRFPQTDVTWREVISIPTPDNVSVAVPLVSNDTPEPAPAAS